MFPWPRLILCLLVMAWGLRTAICARRATSATGSLLALTPRQRRVQGIVVAVIGVVGAVGVVAGHLRG